MKAFLTEVYGEIKYPAAARGSKVEGVVYLSMNVDPDGQIRNYEVTSRGVGESFGGENIVVVGYPTEVTATGGTTEDLLAEVRRIVGHLNETGLKYEDSGYDVPVTYGLSFRFKLEE